MSNIKDLGNKQLGLYHEALYTKIYDLQTEIVEHISDILKKQPYLSTQEESDPKKFLLFCERYQTAINKETKKLLYTLITKTEEIKEEIKNRQKNMLKKIGITTPSMRVYMIMEKTQGDNFACFSDMIQQIQILLKNKGTKKIQHRNIFLPKSLETTIKNLNTTRENILLNNEGPIPN